MATLRLLFAAFLLAALTLPAFAADDILDAIEAARKAYLAGDMAGAKHSLDLASQLVGQKNAENFGALLPAPLPGWKAEKIETTSVGVTVFGVTAASRRYIGLDGHDVEVRITGDSKLVVQFAQFLIDPAIAGAMGKLISIGDQHALLTNEGTINMVVADKFLVTVEGSADTDMKLAYAKAVDIARLSKM